MLKPEEILQNARKAKGYTQESIAAKLGLSSRMYQRYEEGRFPQYKTKKIREIDKLLDTNIHELIYDKKVPRGTLELNEELAQYGSALNRLLSMLEKEQNNVSKAHEIIKILADKVPKLPDGELEVVTSKNG